MVIVEGTVVFARPIDEVFAYLGDQTNAHEWQAGIVEARRTTDGPPRVGATHSLVRTFMGRRMEATNVYTAYEPNKLIAFRSTSGPVPFEASYVLESTATGTKVTGRLVMRPAGLYRLMAPLMAAMLRRETTAAMVALKSRLEAVPPAVLPPTIAP